MEQNFPNLWNIKSPIVEHMSKSFFSHTTNLSLNQIWDKGSHNMEHWMSWYETTAPATWNIVCPIMENEKSSSEKQTIVGVGEHIIRVVGHFLNRGGGGSQLWRVPRCATATYA